MTPILQEKIRWRLYPMHAGFCLVSIIMVWTCYPETAGVPLEEMGLSFSLCHDFEFRKPDFFFPYFLLPSPPFFPVCLAHPLFPLTIQTDELFGDQTPSQPLLGRSNSFDAPPDGGPLRRSHSHASFRKGMPHEHSDAAEPPKSNRPRHRRTLSGSASLPGRGGPGVEGVRDWWSSSSRNGSQTFSRPGSRSTTPGPGEGGRRNYQTVRQSEEEEAIL